MRSHPVRTSRARAARDDDDIIDRRNPPLALLQALGWSARDGVAFVAGALATIAILVNVLFMQTGAHPAPMFKSAVAPVAPVTAKEAAAGTLPRARPVEAVPVRAAGPAAPRTSAEIISDIQRELARRGFYEGAVDGRYGPKTDAAIRDFEQTAGLKPSAEPNEALLQVIVRSNARSGRAAPPSAAGRPAAPARHDPIAELLATSPSKRVVAVQRALAEYGYGQIKPSGIVDAETRSAIEKFERERRLPITGQVSDRVARELAALTGRPLE